MKRNPETFSQLLERVTKLWRRLGLSLRPGASLASIAAFEVQYGFSLPSQMRQYFLTIDGMDEGVGGLLDDVHGIRFWPIAEVKPVSDEVQDPRQYAHCYLFADYFLWSHGYAIYLGQKGFGEIVIVGGPTPRIIAQSFGEFLTKYLDSPSDIL